MIGQHIEKIPEKTLAWFRKPFVANDDDEEEMYCVEILGTATSKMVIKALTASISFRRVSTVTDIFADETGLEKIVDFNGKN